jgi:hypothetical protein
MHIADMHRSGPVQLGEVPQRQLPEVQRSARVASQVPDPPHVQLPAVQRSVRPVHAAPPPTLPLVTPHWQRPAMHVSPALHSIPQPPQLSSSSTTVASQPLALLPSQSSKPAAHPEIAQTSPAQVVVAFGRMQGVPHPPQWVTLSRLFSQPFVAFPSQFPHPALHVPSVHTSPPQLALAFGREHPTPHPPQWVTLSRVFSQPLPPSPSQLPKPAAQLAIAHTSPPQVAIAFGREHPTPQPPQLERLSSGSSHPLPSLPSQLPNPPLHAAIRQSSPAQVAVALGRVHGVPHAPQFVTLSSGSSQPLASLPSQLPAPAMHAAIRQVSPAQVALA